MIFWLVLVLMSVAAVAAIVLPVLRTLRAAETHPELTDQLRRLDEVDSDLESGDIGPESLDELKLELERAVYTAVERPQQAPQAPGKSSPLVLVMLALLVPLIGFSIYLPLGMPSLGAFMAAEPERKLDDPEVSVDFMLEQVRARLVEEPDDQIGWALLARSEMQRGDYAAAITAAEKLVALNATSVDARLLLVDALAMANGGQLDQRALNLVDQILNDAPANPTANILKGMSAHQDGNLDTAVQRWRLALENLPPESPMRDTVSEMLSAAGAPMFLSDSGQSDPGQSDSGQQNIRLNVSVMFSAAEDHGLPGGTPVFVFARDAEQAGPPLAAAKLRLDQLPVTIALDESMEVMPGRGLAEAKSVYVVARIAVSGNATGGPDDIEVRSANFAPTAPPAVIELNLAR